MGLIELASGNSVWRGMEYYNAKKTKSVEKTVLPDAQRITGFHNGAIIISKGRS